MQRRVSVGVFSARDLLLALCWEDSASHCFGVQMEKATYGGMQGGLYRAERSFWLAASRELMF